MYTMMGLVIFKMKLHSEIFANTTYDYVMTAADWNHWSNRIQVVDNDCLVSVMPIFEFEHLAYNLPMAYMPQIPEGSVKYSYHMSTGIRKNRTNMNNLKIHEVAKNVG